MKIGLVLSTLLLLFYEKMLSNSLFTEKYIASLEDKVTRKIDIDNINSNNEREKNNLLSFSSINDYFINYDPNKVSSIIKGLNAPEKYDFFDKTGCPKKVKEQRNCGCCWSIASTNALSYRFWKNGIKVNLSPQYGLSCYKKDCNSGSLYLDAALNLVKNGTVTEECQPYLSGDGKIRACPTKCKDGSALKKYYAKEIYTTEDSYSKDNFYDIVTLMIYQLIKYGPFNVDIFVFQDFFSWCDESNKYRSRDEAYYYDGISDKAGSHLVTLVGYGKIGEKYYWKIENTWGIYSGYKICQNWNGTNWN